VRRPSRAVRLHDRDHRQRDYLATRRLEVLVVGLFIAFSMFLVIFLLPTTCFRTRCASGGTAA